MAIARALVNRPRLLLADEPTGNLDSTTGAEVLDLLLKLQVTTGMTVVLATHDPQVAACCTRLVKLQDGKIVDDVQTQGRLRPPEQSRSDETPERRSGI